MVQLVRVIEERMNEMVILSDSSQKSKKMSDHDLDCKNDIFSHDSIESDSTCSQRMDCSQSMPMEEQRTKELGYPIDNDKLFFKTARTGYYLHKSGMVQDALRYYGQALRLKNRTIESEPIYIHAAVSDILYFMAEIHMDSSDSEDRIKCIHALDLCLDLRKHCFGNFHKLVALTLYKFAEFYMVVDDHESTLSLLLETLYTLQSIDSQDSLLVDVWKAVSKVQLLLGRYDEAKSSMMEAFRIAQKL